MGGMLPGSLDGVLPVWLVASTAGSAGWLVNINQHRSAEIDPGRDPGSYGGV